MIELDKLRVGGDGQVWKWCGPVEGQRRVASGAEVHLLKLPKDLPLEWQWLVEKSKILAKNIKPRPEHNYRKIPAGVTKWPEDKAKGNEKDAATS